MEIDARREDLKEFAERPVVFMFQPTEFQYVAPVAPERLVEWERTMEERVGTVVEPSDEAQARRSGTKCYSWCGDVVFDDCDEI